MSILARLIVLVLLTLSPTILARGVNDVLLYREREQEVREAALATAVIRNAELDRIAREIQHLLGPVSRSDAVTSLRAPSCNSALSTLMQEYSDEDLVLAATDLEGIVLCASTPNSAAVHLGDRAFVQSTIHNRQFTIGEYVLSRVTGRKAITFGQPIFNQKGEVAGALIAYLGLGVAGI